MGFFKKVDPEVQALRDKAEIKRLQEKKEELASKRVVIDERAQLKSEIKQLKQDTSKFDPEKVQKIKSFLSGIAKGPPDVKGQPKKKPQPSMVDKMSGLFGAPPGQPQGKPKGKQQSNPFGNQPNPFGNMQGGSGGGFGFGGSNIMSPQNGKPKKKKGGYNPNNWY